MKKDGRFHAQIARRSRRALALRGMLTSLDIRVPASQRTLGAGETYAVETISRLCQQHGTDTVVLALRCINESGDGNAGELRAEAITAVTVVLARQPEWRDAGLKLLESFDTFDFAHARQMARQLQYGERGAHGVMIGIVAAHLSKLLKET
jgi:hypothetical protein